MLSKIKSKRECKRIEPLLWGYAAAHLAEAESVKVQRHLNTCNACDEQIKAYEQTIEGISILRNQPVPASLSNWQDVQRRLDAVQAPASVPLTPVFSWRKAATGVALAGMACLLAGMVMAWKQGGSAVQDAGGPLMAREQSEVKPVKKNGYYDKRITSKSSETAPLGKLKNKGKQREGIDAVSKAIEHVDMSALVKNLRSFRRNGRHGHRWASAPRRHHKHLRSSYMLAYRSEHKAPLVLPTQVASASPKMLVTAPQLGMERTQPEYVLTTIVDSAPQPRDFVMDTMRPDSQKIGSNAYSYSSCNNADTADDKEIRGW